jgi:hypothetical protein
VSVGSKFVVQVVSFWRRPSQHSSLPSVALQPSHGSHRPRPSQRPPQRPRHLKELIKSGQTATCCACERLFGGEVVRFRLSAVLIQHQAVSARQASAPVDDYRPPPRAPQLHCQQQHGHHQRPVVPVPCGTSRLTTVTNTEWTWMPGLDGSHLHPCKEAPTHLPPPPVDYEDRNEKARYPPAVAPPPQGTGLLRLLRLLRLRPFLHPH